MLGHRLFFQLYEPFQQGIDTLQHLLEKKSLDNSATEQLYEIIGELRSVALFIGVAEAAELLASVKRYHEIYLDAPESDYDPVLLTQSLYNLKRYFNYLLSRKKRLPNWIVEVTNQINSQAGFENVREYQFFDYSRSAVELAGKWHRDARAFKFINPRVQTMIKRLAGLYQQSYKQFLKGDNAIEALDKMQTSTAYLNKIMKPTAFHMLTSITMVALRCVVKEPSAYTKLQRKEILGRVGLFFSQLCEKERALDKLHLQKEIIKPLLYLISLAHPNKAEVIEIRKRFNFPSHALPQILLDAESKRLSKPDGGILLSAAEMIDKELLVIRDQLDIIIRQAHDDSTNKERSFEILSQLDNISKTLRMLEMDKEASRLHVTLQTFNEQNQYNADSLEGLMSEVLQLEASLKEFKKSNVPINNLSQVVSFVAGVTDLDDAKLMTLVNIKESLTKVERIIEKMLLANDYNMSKWKDIVEQLNEKRGALRFLHMDLLADVLENAQQKIAAKLKGHFNLTKQEKYELIDLIAKVDLFVSSYVDKKPVDDSFVINSNMRIQSL